MIGSYNDTHSFCRLIPPGIRVILTSSDAAQGMKQLHLCRRHTIITIILLCRIPIIYGTIIISRNEAGSVMVLKRKPIARLDDGVVISQHYMSICPSSHKYILAGASS